MIVRVKEELPQGKHLGDVVAGFKGGCSKAAMNQCERTGNCGCGVTVPPPSGGAKVRPLFEPGYNDKILMHEGQLDNWKAYLDDNPRRLLLKRQNPQLFTVLHGMEVAGHSCQVVGNRFLLDIPDKMAVIVHRRYSDDENALLRENGFPKLYKPCGESFDACTEGLLLQISPWDFHMEKKTITREQCLELNSMAERIANVGC